MYQLQKFRKLQSGFTLIEIAIVMVIIGLLLGGVLKGQEMITNAQIKRVINDYDGITAAVYGYLDRYTALPGDDNGAVARFTALADGNANGVVAGAWNVACADAIADPESCHVWEHMRLSGILSGSGNTQPTNAFGGIMGIENAATSNSTLAGHIICMAGVAGDIAVLIDNRIDDGAPDTGTVRSMIAGVAPAAGVAYVPAIQII